MYGILSSAATLVPSTQDGFAEKLLLAAVVRRAAFDIVLYRDSPRLTHKKLAEEAYYWMFIEQSPRFMSFVTVCEVLGQDPAWIRQQTLKLTRSDVRKFDRITA